MIDETVEKYLTEGKEEINWKYHFEQFGGYREFLKKTGLEDDAVRMYISTGEVPESAREKIRRAVAKRIINKSSKFNRGSSYRKDNMKRPMPSTSKKKMEDWFRT